MFFKDLEKLTKRTIQGDLSTVEELCSYWNKKQKSKYKATSFIILINYRDTRLVKEHENAIIKIKDKFQDRVDIDILFLKKWNTPDKYLFRDVNNKIVEEYGHFWTDTLFPEFFYDMHTFHLKYLHNFCQEYLREQNEYIFKDLIEWDADSIEEYNFSNIDNLFREKDFILWKDFLKINCYDKYYYNVYESFKEDQIPLYFDVLKGLIPDIDKQFANYKAEKGFFWNEDWEYYDMFFICQFY